MSEPVFALITGGGTGGHTYVGLNDQAANSRFLTVLSDNRVVLTGGASPPKPSADAGTQSQQAGIAILTADGQLDTTFSTGGPRLYDLGGPATGRAAHFFWGAAEAPDHHHVAVVGIRGAVTAVPDAGVVGGNDQAVFLYTATGN